MTDATFWRGKRVFLSGHTGFKGAWLSLWLHLLGAEVTGYALEPPTTPSLFELAGVGELVHSVTADVRDLERLTAEMTKAAPEIVFHMAAQPLVRDSYRRPVDTYATNVMGTVNLLEAVRGCPTVRAVVNVTTDKCYENREWVWGYRENEPMGGYDPYSSSKGCSELVTAAYRASYFNPREYARHGVAVASARAGNVIGGGDWADDRLIPDCIRAIIGGETINIRYPRAVRPWQHVLEPLSGYLTLAGKLFEEGPRFCEGWNFGPGDDDCLPVELVVRLFCEKWGEGAAFKINGADHPHEAGMLRLDCSKARHFLDWRPKWGLEKALEMVVEWSKACQGGKDVRGVSLRQIGEYMEGAP